MIAPADAAAATSRRAALAAFAVVLVPVVLALAMFAVQGRIAGLAVDDAFYLLMADRWFGRLSAEPALAALLDTRTYPPLYPLVLGVFGGGSDGLLAAHVVNAALVAAWCTACLAYLLRAGVPAGAAAALTLGAAFAPFTLYHAQELWSEHLYLALQMLALACLATRPGDARAVLLAGAAVGLALLTRTMGVALVVAFAAWLVWHRPARWPLALALAALPVLERFTHDANVYGNELQGWATGDWAGALARLQDSAIGLWTGWRLGLSMTEPPAFVVPLLLLALAAIGWAERIRRGTLDALLVPVCLGTAWLWGFSAHAPRFLYPLWPLLLYHAWIGACRLLAAAPALRRAGAGAIVASALSAIVVVPALWHVAARMRIPVEPHLADYKRIQKWLVVRPPEEAPRLAAVIDLAIADNRRIRSLTPAGACVHTDTLGLTMVYARRVPFRFPWRSVEELAAAGPLPCRFAYIDPEAVAGARDDAALAAAGIRVLHWSGTGDSGAGLLIEPPGALNHVALVAAQRAGGGIGRGERE